MRKPSIFYRIKSKQGEYLSLFLISHTFGKNNYDITIKGAFQEFHYRLNDYKQKISLSDLSTLCVDTLNSPEFNVNCFGTDNADCQNMCHRILELYGNEIKNIPKYIFTRRRQVCNFFYKITFSDTVNEVECAIFPYFIAKTKIGRENIFFDSKKTEIMGGKYNLEVQIYLTKENIEYSIPFIQFVVDDKLSACLPYIEYYVQ